MSARFLPGAVCALLLGVSVPSHAVTVVKCRDSDGTEFFASYCPGGAVKLEEQRVRLGSKSTPDQALADAVKANPVVLFTVPDCDACDLVRQQLRRRGVPFTEKNVESSAENQASLRDLSGGGTTVPTVGVGKRSFTGYSRAALELGLDQAGYPPRTGGDVATTP